MIEQLTAEAIVTHTKSIFAGHGIPEVVVLDNGPQYTSELYAEFAKKYQFQHVTSSPNYPQSNGKAERAVKTMKSMLKKCDDPYTHVLSTTLVLFHTSSNWLQSFTAAPYLLPSVLPPSLHTQMRSVNLDGALKMYTHACRQGTGGSAWNLHRNRYPKAVTTSRVLLCFLQVM